MRQQGHSSDPDREVLAQKEFTFLVEGRDGGSSLLHCPWGPLGSIWGLGANGDSWASGVAPKSQCDESSPG